MELSINSQGLKGELAVPGDKSISHRSIMFGAISQGITRVTHFLQSDDCQSTVQLFQQLGVKIFEEEGDLLIEGQGGYQFSPCQSPLDVGNSGTTIRLVMGILAQSQTPYTLIGDASIKKRPMNRVMAPLTLMGADIKALGKTGCAPLTINPVSSLTPINYQIPIASAQVKSALLFAALQGTGTTRLIEKEKTRDHTEAMIRQFGGQIDVKGKEITLTGPQTLRAAHVIVPGDISSAAFFIAGALLVPGSDIVLTNVGLSPTRTGMLDVVREMGGHVTLVKEDTLNQSGDIRIKSSELRGCVVEGEMIPRLIDELPLIALLATQAKGTTVIRDAEELRVKETDRISAVATELTKMGADIKEKPDGLIIQGGTPLHGACVTSFGDHRIGMMLQIAGLIVSTGSLILEKSDAISISYPHFFTDLASLDIKEN